MPFELETSNDLQYKFYQNSSGFTQFRIRAPNDAHLALSPVAAESTQMYEIIIGGWGNSKSVIRKNRTKPDVCEAETVGILMSDEFRGFWIRWENGNISVGREGDSDPFLNWTDFEVVPINFVGVCTGWGASGSWCIEDETSTTVSGGGAASSACWVSSSGGKVPSSAVVGGEDNGNAVYVVRAQFNNALIPGKLIATHGAAYIPWGGKENNVDTYEVLCDCSGEWVACSGSNIPGNAFPAGESEDGETLYVGRVVNDGTLTVGKVQPSHGVLYIPYGGRELSFQDYEVFVQ